MTAKRSNGRGSPLCSYVLASGDMFYTEANQRMIYMRDDPVEGFRIWGEAPGHQSTTAANLAQVLLEYSMTCEACGNIPQAYRQIDAFGKRLGQELAIKIIESMPAKEPTSRAIAGLQCVFESMNCSFKMHEVDGEVSYELDHCPLCEKAAQIGLRQVELAHHGLNALCQSQIDAIAPGLSVRLPSGSRPEHVFSVLTSPETTARRA